MLPLESKRNPAVYETLDGIKAKEVVYMNSDFEASRLISDEVAKQLGFLVIKFSELDFRMSEAILYTSTDHLLESKESRYHHVLEVSGKSFGCRLALLSKKTSQLKPPKDVRCRWDKINGFLMETNTKRNDLTHGWWRNFGKGFAGVIRRSRGSNAPPKFQTWSAERIAILAMACHVLTKEIGAALRARELSEARVEIGLRPQPELENIYVKDYQYLTLDYSQDVRECLDKAAAPFS